MLHRIFPGVKGVVSNYHTGLPIQGAQVEIIGRDHSTKTTARGEFWRYLMPSKYYIKVNLCSAVNVCNLSLQILGKIYILLA